jgi:hypothetical protein
MKEQIKKEYHSFCGSNGLKAHSTQKYFDFYSNKNKRMQLMINQRKTLVLISRKKK